MTVTPHGIKSSDIRTWAISNGYPQLAGKNGRLPAAAIQAYLDAHTHNPIAATPDQGAA